MMLFCSKEASPLCLNISFGRNLRILCKMIALSMHAVSHQQIAKPVSDFWKPLTTHKVVQDLIHSKERQKAPKPGSTPTAADLVSQTHMQMTKPDQVINQCGCGATDGSGYPILPDSTCPYGGLRWSSQEQSAGGVLSQSPGRVGEKRVWCTSQTAGAGLQGNLSWESGRKLKENWLQAKQGKPDDYRKPCSRSSACPCRCSCLWDKGQDRFQGPLAAHRNPTLSISTLFNFLLLTHFCSFSLLVTSWYLFKFISWSPLEKQSGHECIYCSHFNSVVTYLCKLL